MYTVSVLYFLKCKNIFVILGVFKWLDININLFDFPRDFVLLIDFLSWNKFQEL